MKRQSILAILITSVLVTSCGGAKEMSIDEADSKCEDGQSEDTIQVRAKVEGYLTRSFGRMYGRPEQEPVIMLSGSPDASGGLPLLIKKGTGANEVEVPEDGAGGYRVHTSDGKLAVQRDRVRVVVNGWSPQNLRGCVYTLVEIQKL